MVCDYLCFVKGSYYISENTANGEGGGVRVDSGMFTMTGGTISGNTADYGGGVYADKRFTKSGTTGIIYGSNAPEEQANRVNDDRRGHAVYANLGLLVGAKKRNTTARATTAMDSGKDGPAGGWE